MDDGGRCQVSRGMFVLLPRFLVLHFWQQFSTQWISCSWVCHLHFTQIDHVLINWVTMTAYNSIDLMVRSPCNKDFFFFLWVFWSGSISTIQSKIRPSHTFVSKIADFSSSTKLAPNKLTSIASMEKLAWWPKVLWVHAQAWWLSSAKGDTGLEAACRVLFDHVFVGLWNKCR